MFLPLSDYNQFLDGDGHICNLTGMRQRDFPAPGVQAAKGFPEAV